jgi:hypothetical protein
MATDITVLAFGIKFDAVSYTVLFSLCVWFSKAFSVTELAVVAIFVAVWALVPALADERENRVYVAAILFAVILLPPDISVIFWVILLHLPGTVVASRDHCSGYFVVASFFLSAAACAYFDFHGRLSLPTTIAYVVFRTVLYVS